MVEAAAVLRGSSAAGPGAEPRTLIMAHPGWLPYGLVPLIPPWPVQGRAGAGGQPSPAVGVPGLTRISVLHFPGRKLGWGIVGLFNPLKPSQLGRLDSGAPASEK